MTMVEGMPNSPFTTDLGAADGTWGGAASDGQPEGNPRTEDIITFDRDELNVSTFTRVAVIDWADGYGGDAWTSSNVVVNDAYAIGLDYERATGIPPTLEHINISYER